MPHYQGYSSPIPKAQVGGIFAPMSEQSRIQTQLRSRLDSLGLSSREASMRAGLNETAVKAILSGKSRSPRYDTLAKLASVLGCRVSDLTGDVSVQGGEGLSIEGKVNPGKVLISNDVDPSKIVTEGLVGDRDLPVYASAMGGHGEMIVSYEPIEYVKRPSILEGVPGGFAMYVVGDSMEPRYEPGEMLLVHPRKSALPGDHVVVVKTNGHESEHEALVKRLVRFNGSTYRLKQYNPADEFDLAAEEVQNCFVVVGTYGRRR